MSIAQIVAKDSFQAAPLLLGCFLCRKLPDGSKLKLRIVETEAYHQDDPASHSFRGMTKRTAPMFMAGGRLYIYFTYGMHYCLNIVTGPAGVGEGVLLRAAEPVEGLEIMAANRRIMYEEGESARQSRQLVNIANGPAKLTQALGIIDNSLSGEILDESSIWLEVPEVAVESQNIVASPRVGISQAIDMPWRFYIRDNRFVSKT